MVTVTDPVVVVCPACKAANRVPATRLGDAPTCGKCRQPLFAGKPIELGDADFARVMAREQIPLVVDFWAPWCGPCMQMAPAFAEAAGTLEPRVHLAKVNTENYPALAAQFGIRGIPTMIAFREGREIARQSGAMTAPQIVAWVESIVSKPV